VQQLEPSHLRTWLAKPPPMEAETLFLIESGSAQDLAAD
jgi:hypothetical protein